MGLLIHLIPFLLIDTQSESGSRGEVEAAPPAWWEAGIHHRRISGRRGNRWNMAEITAASKSAETSIFIKKRFKKKAKNVKCFDQSSVSSTLSWFITTLKRSFIFSAFVRCIKRRLSLVWKTSYCKSGLYGGYKWNVDCDLIWCDCSRPAVSCKVSLDPVQRASGYKLARHQSSLAHIGAWPDQSCGDPFGLKCQSKVRCQFGARDF